MGEVSNTSFDRMRLGEITFLVLDFETVTPKGHAPEPIELAAMRLLPGFQVDRQFEANWLIKPPDDAPLTAFDTQQTGIRWRDLCDRPPVTVILKQLETLVGSEPIIVVAQNARYEYAIIQRFAALCPTFATQPFVDTIALAKLLVPGLPNYRLDTLAQHFSLSLPAHRHRALPDVQLTIKVLLQLLRFPTCPQTVAELRRVAGIKSAQLQKEEGPKQLGLFS